MASISSVQSISSAYDVFLSFHGEDTRSNNFTGFLFQALRRKGIVAFKGHTLLNKREPELLHAIEGPRLSIVVLSENYASSTRCLRELAHIFNCIETSPRRLLPIFYDVDPSDVRKQTGRYEEAFSKHEQRFLVDRERMEEVQTWRKALTRVANLPGWYIPNKPQYTEIEEFVQYIITILGPNISTLQNEAEGTSSDKDEVSYNELSGLMRIRDFISLVLTYPGKLEDENILRSWISAFPEWKAQLLSTGDDTVMDKPWCVLTEKALGSMKGFMPMEIISKVESGERSIFSHNDVDAIPEAIIQQSVDLAVNQLLQTLFSGDYCARYIRLLTRNLAEKGSVVDTIVSAVEDKHTMFGIDKDFLRALWINASTYETDAEVRVQEEININMMMEVDDMGSNGQLVIVVDADSNNKLDLQKLRFPTGIVVLITTEPSTQAEKDVDFRIACTMDLNIWTQDHLLPWKVFCSYVGSCISSSMVRSSMAIQKIAVEIVKECHGHLLAIVLVAKYLTHVQDFKQWELALDKLSSLNPSYDYQDSDRIGISRVMVNAFVNIIWEDIDDAQKLCLELSLPVHNIKNGVRDDILVSDWAKIILGYTKELGEYRRQLQHYINELQDRFVLLKYESGDVYLPVETYDIIQSLHTSKPSILRHGALGLTEPPYIGRWHSLIQIELMDNKICELPQSPDCPKLKVLLLQGNVDLMDIPDSFFNHMPLLQHLDLSYTSIRDLPPSVSKLIQLQKFYLRGCDLFMELPHQIGQLKNLKELDLDGTLITHLPIEIRELINLQSLSLCFEGTSRSTIIPPGLVSNLTQLNYLSINVDPEDERWNENVISVLREICYELKNLQRLSIYVPEADLLKVIPPRKSLIFRLVVGQHMRRLISRVPPELETKFKHCDYSIKFVNGVNVPNGVKMHLGRSKALYLDRHMTIKSLSDFDLRNLRRLKVCILAECNEMETIVSGSNSLDRAASLKLKFLSVFYMKNLRSVCQGSSPFFRYLKSIALHTCPMLTTIFTLDSLKKLSFLEEIIFEDCPKVTTLISHATPEQNPVFFLPKLRMISLLYLPELVNIFNGMHVGPFIEEMIFYYCPRLQNLSKSELSSKSLKIIKGESIWWEALKWNVAEWEDAGRPNYFERIFSPINEEADMMNQLAALQETQLNEYHNMTYQGISSSTQSIAKSSLEIPVLSPLAPVSSVGRGSSNSEDQKRKVVTEPKIFQDASKKMAVMSPVPATTQRMGSVRSLSDAGGEILEEPNPSVVDQPIYVAVTKEVKESRLNLIWAIQNSGGKRICILYVHVRATMVPLLGGKFPASALKEEQVQAYWEEERQGMHRILDDYLRICQRMGVRAEKLHIEMDSIEKGILELVSQHGIRKLVMGAASDKYYNRRMMDLKSKKAISVCKQAPASCLIQFVCKGHLIHTRDRSSNEGNAEVTSPLVQQVPNSVRSLRSQSVTLGQDRRANLTNPALELFRRVRSANDGHGASFMAVSSPEDTEGFSTPCDRMGTEVSSDESDRLSRMSPSALSTCSDSAVELALTPSLINEKSSENALELTLSRLIIEDLHHSSPPSTLDGGMDDTIYDQLEQARAEAENATLNAYQETVRRRKAEKDAFEAIRKVKASESLYTEELNLRKMAEEKLRKEKEELENMKSLRDKVKEELRLALDQKASLESQIASSELMIKELEQKILSAVGLLQSYKNERDELQMQRDNALREAEELRKKQGEASGTNVPQLFSEFSFSEIKEATSNFNPSSKIGEGGYGSIFKGVLRHTEVAIKMLNSDSMQGPLEFQQEVDVLSKLRHPNLITLIGACPDSWALVYEYLPNGSLEDRLACKNNTPPLSWQARIRIAAELCSALIFLHSSKPHSVVHGDLKPSNILLDANLNSKLSDFGICRILSNCESSSSNTTEFWRTDPKGTFVYMDPEFLASGELTPKSDVYSFGIILLRLLTGRPALGITKEVKYALDTGKLKSLLDPLAGDWPFVQAEQLARLALRCCDMNRKSRPDLYSDVWRILDAMRVSSGGANSFGLSSEGLLQPPSYFICPIFQEVMRDPHVAADGFTYEAEAIRGWLDGGHDNSPMTNSKLAHHNLVPNRALRSAIQDRLQNH